MTPGKRKALNKNKPSHALRDKLEKLKASIRAKVEHPFRVIKCQFGHSKARYRGLAKNTNQLLVIVFVRLNNKTSSLRTDDAQNSKGSQDLLREAMDRW